VSFEATLQTERPAEVEEVCKTIDALALIRNELGRAGGLPLCVRLLCRAHEQLMRGVWRAGAVPVDIS
jgi:hypothetical protein